MATEQIAVTIPLDPADAHEIFENRLSKKWPDESAESMANYEFRSRIFHTILLGCTRIHRELQDDEGNTIGVTGTPTHAYYLFLFEYL